MGLLAGEAALRAAGALLAADVVAVVPYPAPAGRGASGAQPLLLALAHAEAAVVIDCAATPQIAALWPRRPVWAAEDGKATHHALAARFGAGGASAGAAPERWACLRLCAQLLAGGREAAVTLAAQARAQGLPAPPEAAAGSAALGLRAQALARVVAAQGRALAAAGMRTASRLEAAAVAAVADMERLGMPFDAEAWAALGRAQAAEAQALARRVDTVLRQRGGPGLPPAAALLRDGPLRQALAAAGHPVTDVRGATLAALPAPLGPDLALLVKLARTAAAYGEGFLGHVGADGRVHAQFEQIGASTGRMACHAPNLQGMLRGTAHRGCFRVRPGRALVVADYAACELRILAELSGDPNFRAAFAAGVDVHAQIATAIFGCTVSHTQRPELRQRAKVVSFGLCYGMGPGGLARTLGVPRPEAEALLTRYFATYPAIRGYLEATAATAQGRGYACTLSGRRLYLDAAAPTGERGQAARVAKNMPIQGTNADIIKLALARLRRALAASCPEAAIVHCVHDELLVEAPAAAAAAVAATVGAEMEAAGRALLATVPLAVDLRVGQAWDA